MPDQESQGTASAHPEYDSSCSATTSVMKAAHHASGVIYVVRSVTATVTNRLSSFETRTIRRHVYMSAVTLLQTAWPERLAQAKGLLSPGLHKEI